MMNKLDEIHVDTPDCNDDNMFVIVMMVMIMTMKHTLYNTNNHGTYSICFSNNNDHDNS